MAFEAREAIPAKRIPLHPFDRDRQCALEEEGKLLLHGCGLVKDGRAYLFLACSGGGKSTLAALSAGETGCLSDEHLLLDTERLILSAPPCCPSEAAPAAAAFILEKTPALAVAPAGPGELLSALARELYPSSWEPAHARLLLERLADAARRLPAFRLGFSLSTDPEALWKAIPRSVGP